MNPEELFAELFGAMLQHLFPLMQELGRQFAEGGGGSFVVDITPPGSPRPGDRPGSWHTAARGALHERYAARQSRDFRDAHGPFPPGSSLVCPAELRNALNGGFAVTIVDCRPLTEAAQNGAFPGRVPCDGADVVALPADAVADETGELIRVADVSDDVREVMHRVADAATRRKHSVVCLSTTGTFTAWIFLWRVAATPRPRL